MRTADALKAGNLNRSHGGSSDMAFDFGGAVAPISSVLVDEALPVFTANEIVEALRTSFLGPEDDDGNRLPDPHTRAWTGDGPITYRLTVNQATIRNGPGDTTDIDNMSADEQTRIAEALEIWDDFIGIDIENDQQAGANGHPGDFIDIFYVDGGTGEGDTSERARTSPSTQDLPGSNEYGGDQRRFVHADVKLGRAFGNDDDIFDGLDAAGAPDDGVFNLANGREGFETVLHETGHALGLSHPGFYNSGDVAAADGQLFAQDSRKFSIMSYFSEVSATTNFRGIYAATPMVYDILAIQAIYGADETTRIGRNTYGFNNNTGRDSYDFSTDRGAVFTIYDAGGTDTLNAARFDSNSVINLRPGSYSSIGESLGNSGPAMLENIGIAYNTIIENAVGGSGNDTITGNTANNILSGHAGNDTLRGGAGADTLNGGLGSDTMAGGLGNDIYYVDTATTLQFPTLARIVFSASPLLPVVAGDRVIEALGQGNDTVRASIDYTLGSTLERLELLGRADLDGTGNGFANTLYGNAGGNTLEGRAGNDSLLGMAGDDILVGGAGRDAMEGHGGRDTFDFNRVSDSRAGALLRDHIIRFSHADGDKIDLRSIDAIAGGADDAFVFIRSMSFAAYDITHKGIAGMVRAFGGVVQIDIGGNRTADMEIQVSGVSLAASDFIL